MASTTLNISITRDLPKAALFLLARSFELSRPGIAATTPYLPSLRAGDTLENESGPVFRVHGRRWWPGQGETPAAGCVLLQACEGVSATNELCLTLRRQGFSLAWVTMSDKGSRGQREDTAGPLAAELVGRSLPVSLSSGFILPDEQPALRAMLTDLALVQGFDLIVTSGGTGVAPRDITPEATLAVIEKRLPGFERAMTATSLAKTHHAVISRAVAGTLGNSLVINLPGSPKAVRECLEPLLPALEHTLKKLQGDPSDCATA